MDHLDNNLPKRHRNHVTEGRAEAAFQHLLAGSEDFVLQACDRKDYGTDCQVEVIDRERATNVRIHVQLKGTTKAENTDGSVSVEIRQSNLNYLAMQAYSIFVCYHVPSNTLRVSTVDAVMQRYEHSGQSWVQQETITVSFSDILTEARLKVLAALARASAASTRDARVEQATALAEDLPSIIKKCIPNLHVPEDEAQAAAILSSLYDHGEDEVISATFNKFSSVLGKHHDAMILCHMAEINLGMAGRGNNVERIEEGISFLVSQMDTGRIEKASLHYSIGNGLSALGRDEEAAKAYETALECVTGKGGATLLAECYKNLGSSYEQLGDSERASELYREALLHNPQLPEAHMALGMHCLRGGAYEAALGHFDQVVFAEHTLGKRSSVSGWRINVLFNLGDGKAAFREINALLGDAGDEGWIWPWCVKQVAMFGRATAENAGLSIAFWDRYLKLHPNQSDGVRERLLSRLYLGPSGKAPGLTYDAFKEEFNAGIQHVQGEAIAHLWDRLGHWAQELNDWAEAERCFRLAYELEGGHYGYCLGTALLYLNRIEECLPVLLAQANEVQPDAMSWFQVAVAYEKLGRTRESVDAYEKAIALNPAYDLAWFNMGGVHWNAGTREQAIRVWKTAMERFPNHELAASLRRDLPSIFG